MIFLTIYSIGLGLCFMFLLRRHLDLRSKYANAKYEVEALEIGKDELQETYEQQFLSHLEQISRLNITNAMLQEEVDKDKPLANWHREHCLPVLEHMRAENTRPVVQDNSTT